MAKLQSGYLFPEINRRKREFLAKNPSAKLISLGIGDTTSPITPFISERLAKYSEELGTRKGYSGYGDEQGLSALRARIAEVFYGGKIASDEVFVSDGAKPDTARLQMMFGSGSSVALQDPAYPVYVDSSVIMGMTGSLNSPTSRFENIVYMPCTPQNNFFPDLKSTKRTDIIFFCSPNNPTGAVATKEQLAELIAFAKKNKSIIIFDAAYSQFIQGSHLPKSIYEIDGAKEVAIEISSFSKPIGFTGVRLGWSVVPKELCYDDGIQVSKDWNRIMTTLFNGASNIAQHGGLAALEKKGLKEMHSTIAYYMENARLIRETLIGLGYKVHGGDHAPYLWVDMKGKNSWDAFAYLLENKHIVTTPGSGFGPTGEGFLRFSSFGQREDVLEAIRRLKS